MTVFEVADSLFHYLTFLLLTFILSTSLFAQCGKKKKKDGKEADEGSGASGAKEVPEERGEQPKAPAQGGVVGVNDPNYQTMAGLGQEAAFGADKKKDAGGGIPGGAPGGIPGGAPGGAPGGIPGTGAGPQAPAAGGIAGTHDPNYQTMAGLDANVFEEKKVGGGAPPAPGPAMAAGGGGPQAPQQGAVAGTFDPNYQTLAGVGGEVFGADKKAQAPPQGQAQGQGQDGIKAPDNKDVKAGVMDPNYQTLAAVGGDMFGADKKGGPGAGGGGVGGGGGGGGGVTPEAPPDKAAKAGTYDPNYQTMAGLGGDVFGMDKRK